MRPIILRLMGMTMILLVTLNAGCRRDLGNYEYTTINEAVIETMEDMYVVNIGEAANIVPKVSYTLDTEGDINNYNYQWLLTRREGRNGMVPVELDNGPVFNARIDLATGIYNMLLRITDKRTGVWTESPFKIFVTIKTYEGWLALSEIGGSNSRLDMFSYDMLKQEFNPIIDVLDVMKSGFKTTGLPNFICYNNMNPGPGPTNDKIMISTTKEAAFLGTDTLDYVSLNAFGAYMNGPDKATDPGAKLEGTSLFAYMTVNGNIYYAGYNSGFQRINKLISNGESFKAGAYVSFTDREAIVFDEQNSRFLWCPQEAYGFYTFDNPQLNMMNKNLLFMARTTYNGGETFAVLKDKTSNKVYLTRLTSARLNYLEEIEGQDIQKAEHFGVNSDFGYVFYNVGSKIYEYDFALKKSMEVADYGTRKISLIKFQDVHRGTAANTERYGRMKNQLIVCSYDEVDMDKSGSMDLYEVPPANGPLKKMQSFKGLGKVVSVTYRSR